MAVLLEVGYNKIVLSYTIPGLKCGMVISGCGTGCIDFLEKSKIQKETVRKYKRKKVRKKVR